MCNSIKFALSLTRFFLFLLQKYEGTIKGKEKRKRFIERHGKCSFYYAIKRVTHGW